MKTLLVIIMAVTAVFFIGCQQGAEKPADSATPAGPAAPTSPAVATAAGEAPAPPPVVVATAPETAPPAEDKIDLTVDTVEGVSGKADADGSYMPAGTANVPKWYKAITLAIDILLPAKSMVAWDNNYVGIGLNVAAYQLNQYVYPNMVGTSETTIEWCITELGRIQGELAASPDIDPTAPKAAQYRTDIQKVRTKLRNLIAPAKKTPVKKKPMGHVAGDKYKTKVKEGGDAYKKKVAEGRKAAGIK